MSLGEQEIKRVLLALKDAGNQLGPSWDRAHELAQAHEGDPAHDRLHAFLHRIEGDSANAAYWYRRAGEPVYDGDVHSEGDVLIKRCPD